MTARVPRDKWPWYWAAAMSWLIIRWIDHNGTWEDLR